MKLKQKVRVSETGYAKIVERTFEDVLSMKEFDRRRGQSLDLKMKFKKIAKLDMCPACKQKERFRETFRWAIEKDFLTPHQLMMVLEDMLLETAEHTNENKRFDEAQQKGKMTLGMKGHA